MTFRTDRHNNPTAFTTDIAKQAGLELHKDYEIGEVFIVGNKSYNTAKLLHDPIDLTVRVIDKISFYNKTGQQRWIYIGMPRWLWDDLNLDNRKQIIRFMYQHEGGVELNKLWKL